MYLTQKQTEILSIVAKGNADGTLADLDEVIARASYKPTKQAIQFTIRALVEHGLIEKRGQEKRRNRMRVVFGVTDLGRHFANHATPSVAATIIEPEESDLG